MYAFSLLAVSAFPLQIWIIPSAFSGHGSERSAAIGVAIGCWVAAAVLLGWAVAAHRSGHGGLQNSYPDLFNLQCLLLAAALILTSAAAYVAAHSGWRPSARTHRWPRSVTA